MPGATQPTSQDTDKDTSREKVYDKNLVRTDFKEQKIQKFFQTSNDISQSSNASTSQILSTQNRSYSNIFQSKKFSLENRFDTKLTSVLKLRKEFEEVCDKSLKELLGKLIFVGTISTTQALIQCDTKLFLCNTQKLW